MAVEALFIHSLGALRPADDAGRELLAKLGNGEVVKAAIKRPRNGKFHRLFWALMVKVHENLSDEQRARYPTPEILVAWFKIATGHCDAFAVEGRGMVYIPKSISFAKMDDLEFGKLFDRCADLIAKNFIHGVSAAEWKREVAEMIGLPSETQKRA